MEVGDRGRGEERGFDLEYIACREEGADLRQDFGA
jgi:hypothetical protein